MTEWNGRDWYVACGRELKYNSRCWEDFVDFGFVSGGGGERYSNAIRRLPVDARIFVYIPTRGYVGVGVTLDRALPMEEAVVQLDGERRKFTEIRKKALYMHPHLEGTTAEDIREYVVPVRWIDTRSRKAAFWEQGMYAARNVVTRLKDPETLEKLYLHFGLAAPSAV